MRIQVLGCAGAEYPGNNSPAFLLDDEILLDAGTITSALDWKKQMRVRTIFITHAHFDHIRSIPFLADNIVMSDMSHRVMIYSIPSVIRTIRHNLFNSTVWPDFTVIPRPDNAIMTLLKVEEGRPVRVGKYAVTPLRVNHTVPSVGYLVEDGKGRRLFYTGDTGPTNGTWKRIGRRKIHGLIIDVSFPNAMEELAIRTGHLTPRLLKAELSKIAIPPDRVYVTHPKPRHRKTIEGQIRKMGMEKVRLLREGETIRI